MWFGKEKYRNVSFSDLQVVRARGELEASYFYVLLIRKRLCD